MTTMPTSTHDLIVLIFMIVNSARVAAYLPQIVRLSRCDGDAAAISASTWFLFLISNVATVAYAAVVLGDFWMGVFFAANALACVAILALTLVKRTSYARSTRRTAVCDDPKLIRPSGSFAR